MKIFLSYAKEDAEPAGVVYQRLRVDGHEVFNWRAPEHEGRRVVRELENRISGADFFLALVSQSFLDSQWCREERDFAIRCGHERPGDVPFVQALLISGEDLSNTGFLGNYGWRDISRPELVGPALDALSDMLRQGASQSTGRGERPSGRGERPSGRGGPPTNRGGSLLGAGGSAEVPDASGLLPGEPVFRNREEELEKVLRGITSVSGPHFWLVTGPPQLGKTWFLDRVGKDAALTDSGWQVNRIDLRNQPANVLADAGRLLGSMFGRSLSAVSEDDLRQIAIGVIASQRPHLYMLDNAELLSARTIGRLRQYLGQIYHRVLVGGQANSRLALIVASRQDDGWRGLMPGPRLSTLLLTEFTPAVVQKALRDMAEATGYRFGDDTYHNYSTLTHRLTEGLPALLARALLWIVDEAWQDLDRMARVDIFHELAGHYIESDLLTGESLFPGDTGRGDDQLKALKDAYRLLAPYRLFTQSHLRHHLDRDPELTDILGRLGWDLDALWRAINGTALLTRPATELWLRIHPAVRRLLYRYFYESEGDGTADPAGGVEAHREAGSFIKNWAEEQTGTEQVVCLVECLWHDANALLPCDAAEIRETLAASARRLSEDLRPGKFSLTELRGYAVKLMHDDEELQGAVASINGLFEYLVEIVLSP